MQIEIRKITKQDLLGRYKEPYLKFFKEMNLETFPEEKPWSDEQITNMVETSDESTFRLFAFDNEEIAGTSNFSFKECTPGFGRSFINVLPKWRRQGIGSRLFEGVSEKARDAGVKTLVCRAHHESGVGFFTHRGGRVVTQESSRALDFSKINWGMVSDWIDTGKNRNPSLMLSITNTIDDAMIPGLATVSVEIEAEVAKIHYNPLNVSIDSEVEHWRRRQADALDENQTWMFLVAYEPCGDIVGYTNLVIQKSDPTFVRQGMTAVKSDCRGSGIGKLLKAVMLDYLRNNHPQVTKVATFNNDMNAPMVGINEKLGFVKGICWTTIAIDVNL